MNFPNIDFDEIQKAMEDTTRDAFDYFFDKETGEVLILSEDILKRAQDLLASVVDGDEHSYEDIEFDEDIDLPDWMEEEVDLALDIFLNERARYIRIPERDPGACYEAMKSFALQLQDNDLKEHLITLLDGRGAFRRFKDALASNAREKKQWYSYNARCSQEEIRKWLSAVIGAPPH